VTVSVSWSTGLRLYLGSELNTVDMCQSRVYDGRVLRQQVTERRPHVAFSVLSVVN